MQFLLAETISFLKNSYKSMDYGSEHSIDPKELLNFIRRAAVFEAFEDKQQLNKRDLADHIDVSRPTSHRILTAFEASEIVSKQDGGYELTPFGEIVGTSTRSYYDDISIAVALKPLLNTLPAEINLNYQHFTDATVTKATYDDPFRPMNRFIELFTGANAIRGFNKSFLEPMYVELAYEQILDGMKTEIIYDPGVVELILAEYNHIATTSFEQDCVAAYIHDELPLALALFEDRIGLGVHTEAMGTPISWIDTDNPDAIAWGNDLFDRYKNEATPLQ